MRFANPTMLAQMLALRAAIQLVFPPASARPTQAKSIRGGGGRLGAMCHGP